MLPSLPHGRGSGMNRGLVLAVDAWSELHGRHLLKVFLLCLAWSAIGIMSRVPAMLREVSWSWSSWTPYLNGVLTMQFNGFAVLLAVVLTDHTSANPLARRWPYLVALAVGIATGTTALWLISQHVLGLTSAYMPEGVPEPYRTFAFRHALHALPVCGLATAVYVARRRAGARQAALRSVQLTSAQTARRVLASRLAAMQARVEPRFLLDALAQVERLYEIDAEAGDRVLRELVSYLRIAIPHIRDPMSTLAREIGLVNAYLNVLGGERTGQAPLRTQIPTADARVPPMVLLPLLNLALAHRADGTTGGFELRADVNAGRLRLSFLDAGDGLVPQNEHEGSIAQIRERLAALYGDEGRVSLHALVRGSEAVLELPHEPVGTEKSLLWATP